MPWRRLALHALGGTATIVAWGYLVWLAVDFGASARGGTTSAWLFLALATVGAMACMFIALLIGAATLRALRATSSDGGDDPPRPQGGRRRAS